MDIAYKRKYIPKNKIVVEISNFNQSPFPKAACFCSFQDTRNFFYKQPYFWGTRKVA